MKKIQRSKESSPEKEAITTFLTEKPKALKNIDIKKAYQEQLKLLFALQRVSKVLTVEVNLQKILEGMAIILAKALKAKWINFWQLTPDKKAVSIVAYYGMKPEYMEHSRQHPISLGTAWIGRAVKTRTAWGTSDIQHDIKLPQELGETWIEAVKKQNVRALLCVPTLVGEEAVGGLCIYYTKPHEFTDFEMRLVTVAANQAATAIRNAEIFTELTVERNKTLAMINSLSDGIIMYDLENKITAFNPRSEELLWVRKHEVLGKKPSELSQDNVQLKNIVEISSQVLSDFESKELLLRDPQKIFLRITNVPVRDTQDRKLGTMRILHDITPEKETEELKTSFVSLASHQLRSPSTGIKWGIDVLRRGELGSLNSEQTKMLGEINNINEHLISLIRDLLDVSRIEEGRFGYEFRMVDLSQLIEKILARFATSIKKRNLLVKFEKPSEPLPKISADPARISLAIENVIDNAITYTPPGGEVNISFSIGSATLILEVKDTGIGIPQDQQKFLFTKFFRARNAIRLNTEGSGLGLWIVNEVIKRHNGKIYVESKENQGSLFSLQFPLNPDLMPRGKIEEF